MVPTYSNLSNLEDLVNLPGRSPLASRRRKAGIWFLGTSARFFLAKSGCDGEGTNFRCVAQMVPVVASLLPNPGFGLGPAADQFFIWDLAKTAPNLDISRP